MRARLGSLLLWASAFSGCLETKVIPVESDDGGSAGVAAGGDGGALETAGAAGDGEAAGAATLGGSSSGGQPSAGTGGGATGGKATGGALSGGAGGGGASNGKGGASPTGGSATSGGSATGGARTTGGAATTGGKGGAGGASGSGGQGGAKLDWLSFVASDAPSSLAPNSALGINGVLYGYGDSCATLTWDAATRCATGKLCDAQGGLNWGIAVGFDFKNTGPDGTPPDTKRLWNPKDVGALGVAWEITGSAVGLQVWVLNMDPIWGTECSSSNCDIAGPPDGDPSPSLVGQLLFSNMVKDVWGSGVDYKYDPARVHALQFKLPAIQVGAESFSFCVQRVGIIH